MGRKNLDRIRTNVFLSREQREQLMRLASATVRPWSEFVREGVDLVLAKYRKRKTKK